MVRNNRRIFFLSLLLSLLSFTKPQQLGSAQTNVPWRAGHASAFLHPYTIIYAGSEDPKANYNTNVAGSANVWAWDSRNGFWYQPQIQVQSGATMLPQIFISATHLPSQGQLLTWVGNTTTNVLQKLDINSWSWSFPTTNFQASAAKVAGYSIVTVENTIYTYGGLSVDNRGYPNINAVQNTLGLLDASSFQMSPGSNGLGLTDHTTCYLKKINSLITFGGSTTGSSTGVTDAINIFNLSTKVWNVQGISTTIVPGARRLHTANCLDDYMVVFGGGTSQPFDSDVWILNVTLYPQMFWQRMEMANQTNSPNPRMGHSSVLDNVSKKLYIFGGWGVTATNDSNMYILDMNNWSWNKIPTTGFINPVVPPRTNNTTPSNTTATVATTESQPNMVGIIVGATVGGLALLALLALALFCCIRSRRQPKDKQDETSSIHDEIIDHLPSISKEYNDSSRAPYRMSKAWSNTSFARHSEIGDYSDRVVTGVLEAVSDVNTTGALIGSPRSDSCRHSKTLLVSDGQVPNEIISQKPNEFSVAINKQRDLPVDHYRHPAEEDENWTLPDPISPIQYIQSNTSHQLSTGTNSTWDTTEAKRRHYPSNTSNTLVAQAVQKQEASPIIYHRQSPLDLLASLGRQSSPATSSNESLTIARQTPSTSSSALSDPKIPLLPEQYQIDSQPCIMGPCNSIVFVTQKETQKPMAIKLFARREAWERECRTLVKLKSPWVVELLEVLTIQENEIKYAVVMERLDETLSTWIQHKVFLPRVVAGHLLKALAWCHDRGIAFCDLKPTNVMCKEGQWKLIDFEASRTINEECVSVITPRYCSPEVAKATTYGLEGANGVVATACIDLWSLGCLIYELETQKTLFPSNIKDDTILHFISHPSPSTPTLNNGLCWTQKHELKIPRLETLIDNKHTCYVITTLLSREPKARGTAKQWMQDPYFIQ
ncbi:hypothetical protein BY458DRAFT_511507 [Sporodiniella umbellata]|nr:hypothetical protein BY458DRAFT_511507 [Sporodiniella umbellata]